MTAGAPPWWTTQRFRDGALLVALLALVASLPGLWNGFAYDDIAIIVENPQMAELRSPLAYFRESYWGPTRGATALYRPLTVLGFALQWQLGSGAPMPFHAVNILLYAGVAVLVLAALRQLLAPGPALLGAVAFAVHPVHVEAVANVVGQAELWVAAAVFGSVALYARDRRVGALRPVTTAAIAALLAIALLFKEHAILLPGLLLVTELAGRGRFAADPRLARSTFRLLLTLAAVVTAYLTLRNALLGAFTGDAAHWSLRGLGVVERATVMLALVPEFVRLLLWPAHLYADYAPQQVAVLPQLGRGHLPGIVCLTAVGVGCVVAWRRRAWVPLAAVAWVAVSLALVSNILFPTGVLLAERTLFLASFAPALLVAWAAPVVLGFRRELRVAVAAAAAALALLAAAHSASRSRVWEDNPTLFATLAIESPRNYRAHFALGEFYAIGGRAVEADSLLRLAISLDPTNLPLRMIYVRELQLQRRCTDALAQLDTIRQIDPHDEGSTVARVTCLLDRQRFTEARQVALVGLAEGWGSESLRRFRIVAESMLVVTDSVDARNRYFRDGRPTSPYAGPLPVTVYRKSFQEHLRQRRAQAPRQSASPPAPPAPVPNP